MADLNHILNRGVLRLSTFLFLTPKICSQKSPAVWTTAGGDTRPLLFRANVVPEHRKITRGKSEDKSEVAEGDTGLKKYRQGWKM